MRTLLIVLAFMSSAASAKVVEVTCSKKAYGCWNSTEGVVCRWVSMDDAVPVQIQMYRDPNFPKEDLPWEVYRAVYQNTYDRHFLTVNVEYRVLEGLRDPISVKASLNAGTVIAEASGRDRIEIGLRNANYGRGFICNSIRVIE